MLAPGGEVVAHSRWAAFAMESLALYPAFVAELEGETEVKIDFRRCGAHEIARTKDEWQEVRARREAQGSLGIRAEPVEGGMFFPDDALVDPRDVTRALLSACRNRGVEIVEQTRALAVRASGKNVEVGTGASAMTARSAVLAAGAWSGSVPIFRDGEPIPVPATFPVRGHLLGYTLAPGSLGPILRHGHTYVMQRSSGFTIAGTSSEQVGFDRELDPRIVADINARAVELCPALRAAAEPVAWLGFRPATENSEPVMERLPATSLWLAYGHYRNGILLAPATAARISGEIAASFQFHHFNNSASCRDSEAK